MLPDDRDRIIRAIKALKDYQMSIWMLDERSDARDREELRIIEQISRLEGMINVAS